MGQENEKVYSDEQLLALPMSDDIFRLISELLCIDVDQIKLDSHLVEQLGADSMELVELAMSLEQELGYTPPKDNTIPLVTSRVREIHIWFIENEAFKGSESE